MIGPITEDIRSPPVNIDDFPEVMALAVVLVILGIFKIMNGDKLGDLYLVFDGMLRISCCILHARTSLANENISL